MLGPVMFFPVTRHNLTQQRCRHYPVQSPCAAQRRRRATPVTTATSDSWPPASSKRSSRRAWQPPHLPEDEEYEDDEPAPVSLAALSKTLRQPKVTAPTTKIPAARSPRQEPLTRRGSLSASTASPTPPMVRQSTARPTSVSPIAATNHPAAPSTVPLPTSAPESPALTSPHEEPPAGVTGGPYTAKAAASLSQDDLREGGRGGAAERRGRLAQQGHEVPRRSDEKPSAAAHMAGVQHPEVSFRNVAELRQMLQARQRGSPDTPAGGDQLTEPEDSEEARAAGGPASTASHPAAARPWSRSASATAVWTGARRGATGRATEPRAVGSAGPSSSSPATGSGPPAVGVLVPPDLEDDKDYQQAKTYALTKLQRAPLASAALARQLTERGHSERVVEVLVGWLRDNGALNDRAYARLYAVSKWNTSYAAPAKIQKELVALGVAAADVAAALVHAFGPTRHICLTGASCEEEIEVRDTLVEAARRHVEQGQRSASRSAYAVKTQGGSGKSAGGSGTAAERSAAAAAVFKERDRNRRRLAMWLQYRGYDIDFVTKMFTVLRL